MVGKNKQIAFRAGIMPKIKDIYLVHLGNGMIGAYKPGRCPAISTARSEQFVDFAESLREDYPGYRLRCINNQGVRDKILFSLKGLTRDKSRD